MDPSFPGTTLYWIHTYNKYSGDNIIYENQLRRLTIWFSQQVEEFNSRPPNTNPSSGRKKDLNPGSLDYKSSILTTRSGMEPPQS